MSYPEPLIQPEKINECVTTSLYSNILSCFKLNRSIHPQEPVPLHSEFLEITSRRRIRIIHIKPSNLHIVQKSNKEHVNKNVSKRDSFCLSSEEYWFTRWNKPLRSGICRCSFRKSQRFSKYSNTMSDTSNNIQSEEFINDVRSMTNLSTSTSHGFNYVENYVEKLVSEILVAALQDYSTINNSQKVKKSEISDIVNVSYTALKDEIDKIHIVKDVNNLLKLNVFSIRTSDNQSINVQNNLSASKEAVPNKYRNPKETCTHNLNKAKPIILLLHGIGSSAEVWWNVLQCLVYAGYEVLAPDMLGHGYSSVPDCSTAYTFSNLLKDIITVFDKYVGCTELGQCIVIGHSFGLAAALARYREQQVVQLVLISGGGPTPLAPPVSSFEVSMFGCMQIFMKPLLFCGMRRTMFYSSRGKHFDVCDRQTDVPSYVLRYISKGQYWPEGDATFHRRILIPTLLVHGLLDSYVTLVQECEMERTIPRSFLEVIASADHMPMLETPEQLCHMLLCFIEWWRRDDAYKSGCFFTGAAFYNFTYLLV